MFPGTLLLLRHGQYGIARGDLRRRVTAIGRVRAIGIRGLNFLLFKQGYDIRKVMADESVPATYLTPNTKGYYRRFRKYAEAVDGRCDIRS